MAAFSAISNALHVLAAVIWVGGMFFAYVVVRPAIGARRFAFWSRALTRFFPWVWGAVVILPATGYAAIFITFGGFAGLGWHVHIMHALGWLMIGLFLNIYFGAFKRLRAAADAERWVVAAVHLEAIRKVILINLCLGFLTIAVASSGRYW
jgi:uncharacterized membrane protein